MHATFGVGPVNVHAHVGAQPPPHPPSPFFSLCVTYIRTLAAYVVFSYLYTTCLRLDTWILWRGEKRRTYVPDPVTVSVLCVPHPPLFVWTNSEADPTSPGTDKDVDYYQHKSGPLDNFMPWRTGWESASDTKLVGC